MGNVRYLTRPINLKTSGRIVQLDARHEDVYVRPSFWTSLFLTGKKDEEGHALPQYEQFMVSEIQELRWKKGILGDTLHIDAGPENDPWRGHGKRRKRKPYKLATGRGSRKHAIAVQLAWALHLSYYQHHGRPVLRGKLPPRRPIPPSMWERIAGKVSQAW